MTSQDIIVFLKQRISEIAEIPVGDVGETLDLSSFGVDSVLAVMIAEDLNLHFGRELIALSEIATLSSIKDIADFICTTSAQAVQDFHHG